MVEVLVDPPSLKVHSPVGNSEGLAVFEGRSLEGSPPVKAHVWKGTREWSLSVSPSGNAGRSPPIPAVGDSEGSLVSERRGMDGEFPMSHRRHPTQWDFEESAVSEERGTGGSPAMKVVWMGSPRGQRSGRGEAGRSPPIPAEGSQPGGKVRYPARWVG